MSPRSKSAPKKKVSRQPARLVAPIDQEEPPYLDFNVVGIGASAGGIEALIAFFDALSPNMGMAFVVIIHLPPDRKSFLDEILAKHTPMPVQQVKDGLRIKPDHVYVIQPGRSLTIHHGALRLGRPITAPAARRPVDDFFRSLAEEQRERSICVIASGMGSNGTAGAQAIKAVGGLCIAQSPETAQFPSMPSALIEAGLADLVLAPEEIPAALDRYENHPYSRGWDFTKSGAGKERKAFEEIIALVNSRTQQDFSPYRKPTILRRIQRRMGLSQIANMADYAQLLRKAPPEVQLLADDLLIHVTGFFRDPEVWVALRHKVIDPLVREKPDGGTLRAWVTACSSGEEAFSLAIMLVEASQRAGKRFDIKIFATDTAERSLNHARAGLFAGGIESDVSPERLKRFFDVEDSSYRVKKELRELVVFAPQNILQDPPFSRLDLCTCRNFLIYVEPATQRHVLDLVHFSLRENGYLLLGNSENISGADELFASVDRKHRIFRRIGATRSGSFVFPTALHPLAGGSERKPVSHSSLSDLTQLARKTLLNAFTPAAVVIDAKREIVYFHGNTNRYFDQPHGKPTRELLSVVREAYRSLVRSATSRAFSQKRPRIIRETGLASRKGKVQVEVVVTPLAIGQRISHYLVTFAESNDTPASRPSGKSSSSHNMSLMQELKRTQDELQSTIDELQASNEDMKAAHEETISVNEELQSTNEELETSKEELQSLNEELTTVNNQLQIKLEELEGSTNDMSSLLRSTDIAVVFLDTRLCIRRYTPAARDLFELIPADIGRPVTDLALKFTDPQLIKDIKGVLAHAPPVDAEVVSSSGRTYVRRTLPYRKVDDQTNGIVLTFVDITARKVAELELRASESRHRLILGGIREYGIFALDSQGIFTGWTPGAERILGYSEGDTAGQHFGLILTEQDRRAGLAEADLAQAAATGSAIVERWHVRKDGSRFWGTGILSILHDEQGRPYGFVNVIRDNTERKLAEEAMQHASLVYESGNASKDHFLANVSHELRTPLSATLLWAKLLLDQPNPDPTLLKEGLTAINRSAKEQQILIEDLMDTAKIVAGKLRLEPGIFDLNRLIQTLLPPIRSRAAEKQLVIHEGLGKDVGVVYADPRRLQQVVTNLLNNAVKFTPAGGRIEVRTQRHEDTVTLEVIDNGKGIRKEFLARIFERFVQVDQGSTPTASGMGLGLAIARQLVEMHDGAIVAKSGGIGQGATFSITLPLPRMIDRSADESGQEDVAVSLADFRILVVEDTAETRHALQTVLVQAGAEVVAVGTPTEALKEYDRQMPDLILSDLGLGEESGHDLIAKIRAKEKELDVRTVPAVALTAYADARNRKKAFESGFQDCLTKPIEPAALTIKLANLLGPR